MLSDSAATEPSLVQRYADLRGQAGGITESVRGMRFNTLLADVLIRDGIDAEADRRGPHGEVDVCLLPRRQLAPAGGEVVRRSDH